MRVDIISILFCVHSIQIVWSMDIPGKSVAIPKKGPEKPHRTRKPTLEPVKREVYTEDNINQSMNYKDSVKVVRKVNITRTKMEPHSISKKVNNKRLAVKDNSKRLKIKVKSNSFRVSENKTKNQEAVVKTNSTQTKFDNSFTEQNVKENALTVEEEHSTPVNEARPNVSLSLSKYRKYYQPFRGKVNSTQLTTEVSFTINPALTRNVKKKTPALKKIKSTQPKKRVPFNHNSVISRKVKEKLQVETKDSTTILKKEGTYDRTNKTSSRNSKKKLPAMGIAVNSTRLKMKVPSKDISCLAKNRKDNLPALKKVNSTRLKNAIFFIESSCSTQLNARQACSIEAAARANSNRPIFVLFPGPISRRCLHTVLFSSLRRYSNINFHKIYPPKFLRNTPLQSLLKNKSINICDIPIAHITSDILKYATLYKYGGIYVDLDMIAVKPFNSLPQPKNWIGKEVDNIIGSAVVSISDDAIGKLISGTILSLLDDFFELKKKENNLSGYYRNEMVTEVLKRLCATADVSKMTSDNCQGFEVYDSEYFYPVRKTRNYFKKHEGNVSNETFAYYIWNSMYANKKIPSNSLYAYLVNSTCPAVKVVGKYQFSTNNE